MVLTGARIIIEEIINHGIKTVFGYPGGAVLNIYDALYKCQDRIHHVITAHEQGAVHAADGYARVTGYAGVVIATSGPGATNLVTGIANAYLDSVPMVAITGNVAVALLGKDSFQEVDIVGITQSIVKHSFIVKDVAELQTVIRQAFFIANSGRKGPVLIDVPKSVQSDSCDYQVKPISAIDGIQVSPDNQYAKALSFIQQSERPFIYCGGGVIASQAEAELLRLSKQISAPVGTSMMGVTALPASYPYHLGVCGMHGRYASSKAQSECDLLIAIGVRFSDRATGNVAEYTKRCRVLHIDIDEAEFDKNVQSHLSLCGDAKAILTVLLNALPTIDNRRWLQTVDDFKSEEIIPDADVFSPYNILKSLSYAFSDETVVSTDVGQHQMWTMQHYPFEKPRTLLTSGGLGTMGYGFGAAIGGCLANNKQVTLLITSEGSFGMNLNEMATAVSQGLPIVIILLNNGVLGMVRQWQTVFYEERYAHTTLNRATDFKALAQSFGATGYTAKTLKQLKRILQDMVVSGPVLIDCMIDRDERVLPMIPPGGSINNIIVR